MRKRSFWVFYLAALAAFGAGYWLASRAMATEKPAETKPQTQSQSNLQNQSQTQGNSQTVNAGGGQGGGASNQLAIEGDRTTAIGFSTTAPIPLAMTGPQMPPCWLPTRARSYFFGAYSASANFKRDETCIKDLEAARAHELAMATVKSEQATVEAADVALGCTEKADRAVQTCVSK